MGFYITCEYCGEEFKGRILCDCANRQALSWAELWIGSTVIDHKVFPDIEHTLLYYHIKKTDKDYYFCMCISTTQASDFTCGSNYSLLTKEEYDHQISRFE